MSRRLRPDELDLWRKVADSAERMHRPKKAKVDAKSKPSPIKPDPQPRDPVQMFQVGQKSKTPAKGHDLMSSVADRVKKAPVHMDRKTHTRMKRGKLRPDGRFDLHGMTMDRAHPALTWFIMRSGEGPR